MLGIIAMALALPPASPPQPPFYLRDGDRVVFHGDSIAEQAHYTNFIEACVLGRYPGLRLEFFNVGWAGDTTWGTSGWDGAGGPPDLRVRRDIAPLRPTVVGVMFGMNDGGYVPYDPKIEELFRSWYGKVLRWIRDAAPGVRFSLLLTSPWDDTTRPPSFPGDHGYEGGYNDVLLRYGEAVRALAKEHDAAFVDLNRPLVAAMARAKAKDASLAQQIVPDWIHPGLAGGALMAAEVLKAWGMGPHISSVRLDAATRSVVESQGAKIVGYDGVAWRQTDASLPFPLDIDDKTTMLAVGASDLVSALDLQTLAVSRLPSGRHRLFIDDTEVGTFTAEEWDKGINLALLPTPMLRRSLELHRLTVLKNRAFFVKWREVGLTFVGRKGTAKAESALEGLRKELCVKQRAVCQPRPHRFRLSPVG